MKSIFCLMGPTASGKTELALRLAEIFPFEIISVDSAMVYRGLDIGTSKPSPAILEKIPHHLINIREPSEPYSAADFRADAWETIQAIFARQKIPLLVGGTMLYFRALQKGLSDLPSANMAIRQKLMVTAEQEGWEKLHERLKQIDPIAAQRIHPHDRQRIQRALEVFELTQKNITSSQTLTDIPPEMPFNFHNLAIAPQDRAVLHTRIEQRFQKMLSENFLAEVQQLFNNKKLSLDTPAIRAVGYRQAWQFLLGQISYEDMIAKAIIATRQLAKRQLTWLRHWPAISWFDSENPQLFENVKRKWGQVAL